MNLLDQKKRKLNMMKEGGVENMMRKGFTLIELLIVIVIIGILAGVVLTVINPQQQMRRARQTVFRTNAEKACLALHACTGSTQNALTCDTLATKVGFNDPGNPTGAAYTLTNSGGAAGTLTLTSVYDDCTYVCSATPANGTVTNFTQTVAGANCIID